MSRSPTSPPPRPIEQRESLVSGLKAACARSLRHGRPGVRSTARRPVRHDGRGPRPRPRPRRVGADDDGRVRDFRSETRRALRRFALIAVAGELASDLGVLPVDSAKIHEAARSLALAWLGASAETDEQRIIASVRAFILAHESRFERVNEPSAVRRGRKPDQARPGSGSRGVRRSCSGAVDVHRRRTRRGRARSRQDHHRADAQGSGVSPHRGHEPQYMQGSTVGRKAPTALRHQGQPSRR
ncbi:MAG: hypothetical protein MZV65_41770 [Chromatiales bacterium]|nr:hypothetical protein [Chromatiales bacterium]